MKLKTRTILFFVFVVIMIIFLPNKSNAYVGHTRAESLEWMRTSLKNQYVDADNAPYIDGVYRPYQCVDLVKKYYDYLGVGARGGDATAYLYDSMLPDGWTRKWSAAPGDIVVWAPGANRGVGGNTVLAHETYGHVGLVLAINSDCTIQTLENNGRVGDNGLGPCLEFTRSVQEGACFIRPDFFDITVGVDSYKNTKISWDTVAGATKYAVWIEGDPVYKYYGEACSYDFSGWNNGTYNVFVGAYNTELIRLTTTIPITIENFDIMVEEDNDKNVKISWDTVAGATKYAVWIEGDPVYKYYGEACSYDFSGWNNGTYNVFIGAYNTELIRVTQTIPITINNNIKRKGDINEDGKVNGKDWNRLYEHINETKLFTEEEFNRADINGDGKVNGKDWNRLYEHINETNPLW